MTHLNEKRWQHGFNDGSGQDHIVAEGIPGGDVIAKTNWGCSCCQGQTTQEQIDVAARIVKDHNVALTVPELLLAIEHYFTTYTNKPKAPKWCERLEAARKRLNRAIKATLKETDV